METRINRSINNRSENVEIFMERCRNESDQFARFFSELDVDNQCSSVNNKNVKLIRNEDGEFDQAVEKAKEFIKITRDLYGGTFNIEPYELDAPMPTYKEYLFFEAYIEDDIVAKSNFEFYFTDEPNEIKFFRQSDGSYDKICIGTIKLKSNESLDKAKERAVKVVQDEFYAWMMKNKL